MIKNRFHEFHCFAITVSIRWLISGLRICRLDSWFHFSWCSFWFKFYHSNWLHLFISPLLELNVSPYFSPYKGAPFMSFTAVDLRYWPFGSLKINTTQKYRGVDIEHSLRIFENMISYHMVIILWYDIIRELLQDTISYGNYFMISYHTGIVLWYDIIMIWNQFMIWYHTGIDLWYHIIRKLLYDIISYENCFMVWYHHDMTSVYDMISYGNWFMISYHTETII